MVKSGNLFTLLHIIIANKIYNKRVRFSTFSAVWVAVVHTHTALNVEKTLLIHYNVKC